MIENKFLETIKEYKLLARGDFVLAAVSGGADSTALLNLLARHKQDLGIDLHVAHLNHMLRKNDAELDVKYVQGLAQNLKIPATVEALDVQTYAAEAGGGLEEAARHLRYDFFERVAGKIGANKIAVGHTADDNVETFLMRLLRGSGAKGLCGIPICRGKIIRPLIKIWRKEIEDYVGGLKLVPRRDYTNYESKFMRNRVRLKLIPQLKIYNLNIKEIILQTILLLTEDAEYLDKKAEEALNASLLYEKENELALEIDRIAKMDLAVQGHLIRKAIDKIKGNLRELSYIHVHNILEMLEATEKWEQHLPGGVFAAGNREKLIFTTRQPVPFKKKSFRCTLAVPGEVDIPEIGKKIRATLLDAASSAGISADSNIAFVDYSTLGKKIEVRNRAEGDRIIPLGMKGVKKLQDLFVDEKIPLEARDSVPILESGGRIVWVGGVRMDERAKITKATKRIVMFELL